MMSSPTPTTKSNPGRKLVAARRKKRLARKEVAQRLNTTVSDIKQLDEWQLDKLANPERARQLVRSYARMLSLNTAEFESLVPAVERKQPQAKSLFILSQRTAILGAITVALIALGFITWQTYVATAAPTLNIYEPQSGSVVTTPVSQLRGETSEQAQIFVNGISVPVDPSGVFSTELVLNPGPNTYEIKAINSFGREQTENLVIIYQ
jgi:cytoskeletal protein RodZ